MGMYIVVKMAINKDYLIRKKHMIVWSGLVLPFKRDVVDWPKVALPRTMSTQPNTSIVPFLTKLGAKSERVSMCTTNWVRLQFCRQFEGHHPACWCPSGGAKNNQQSTHGILVGPRFLAIIFWKPILGLVHTCMHIPYSIANNEISNEKANNETFNEKANHETYDEKADNKTSNEKSINKTSNKKTMMHGCEAGSLSFWAPWQIYVLRISSIIQIENNCRSATCCTFFRINETPQCMYRFFSGKWQHLVCSDKDTAYLVVPIIYSFIFYYGSIQLGFTVLRASLLEPECTSNKSCLVSWITAPQVTCS